MNNQNNITPGDAFSDGHNGNCKPVAGSTESRRRQNTIWKVKAIGIEIANLPKASQRSGRMKRIQKANTAASTITAGDACQPTNSAGIASITIRSINRTVAFPSGSSLGSAVGQNPFAKYRPKAMAATNAVITRITASKYLPSGRQSSLKSICHGTTISVG